MLRILPAISMAFAANNMRKSEIAKRVLAYLQDVPAAGRSSGRCSSTALLHTCFDSSVWHASSLQVQAACQVQVPLLEPVIGQTEILGPAMTAVSAPLS